MAKSPLTEGAVKLFKKLPVKKAIEDYEIQLGLDISNIFEDILEISLYQCLQTGYIFFHPFNIAGDGKFYEKLQKFDWYYNPWKWEHAVTIEIIKEGDKVLEVGCANGDFLARIKNEKQAEVFGLELNEKALKNAIGRGLEVYSELVQDFAEHHTEEFDVVCSFQVLEHISDVKSFLDSKIKCLKKGGRLIIAVPNNDSFIKWDQGGILNFPPHHMGWWNKNSLKSLQDIFSIRLDEIMYEPLQDYHFHWYIRSWADKFLKYKLFKSVFYRLKINKFFELILRKRANRIKGHSILTVYTKL